jgi:Fic family protein
MWKAFDMKLERVSGKYVQQPQGYKAFVPEPLPPEPAVRIDERMNTALSRGDRALGRLDGSIETLPHPELFLSMFVRREAVLSSQIEGTQASLSDVIKAEADIADRARPSDVLEVQNCMAAIERGTQLLKDLPISTRLITELHRILMTGVRGEHQNPGEIRESQNWIGPAGCTLSDALFIPPPRNEVHRLLGQLENFLHDESPIPPLIRIGLAHAQFETIHPFLDGNGRVGRLLITLFLVEKTLLRRPVLYLSYYFKRHRAEYYDRLQGVRDRGDWEAWLYFFLEGVAQVANLAAETAQKVLRLREDHRQIIIDTFERASATPLRVLDKLYRLPVTSANVVMSDIGTSFPTANNIVRQLEKIGILREMTGQRRNRFYLYQTYMSLFDEL